MNPHDGMDIRCTGDKIAPPDNFLEIEARAWGKLSKLERSYPRAPSRIFWNGRAARCASQVEESRASHLRLRYRVPTSRPLLRANAGFLWRHESRNWLL